ncbi:LysR family transcriptional regulator [Rhodoferax sp. PAMC 29310]|uniref:LysR family transcriptional regulator n=1 Tax=Rhodoferax sp. PAMC 29310 TaxID=2822760 RepID=UPI001B324CA0
MKRLSSLNAIKAYRKVAEVGGISGAAAQLHVCQSAVSRFISLLETELGAQLFHRKEGFILTSAGKTFYEHVSDS